MAQTKKQKTRLRDPARIVLGQLSKEKTGQVIEAEVIEPSQAEFL
jgi:hypothetical protein